MNPLFKNDVFVPDGEAHVWEDGRIYVYGSWDIMGDNNYCSDVYHVFSSDDMENWTDHGVCFSSKQMSWVPDGTRLYAPDCAYKDGVYYLYYCIPDGRCGVAKSASPTGPFTDVGEIRDVLGIDPAVLIDDDGQGYLYWGQFDNVRVAKLKDNMTEIMPETMVQPLSVKEHEFHEGSSVKKINGKYYFLFTDTHRHGGRATSLGYAVSDHPMHGFQYKGIIIDNFGCDPKTWNNHGSMAEFHGQWYIFYHRSTHASVFSRHICAEPIEIKANGTIPEVKMTTAQRANASIPMQACRACMLYGNVRIAEDKASKHTLALTEIAIGDSAVYRYVDFDGEDHVCLRLQADGDGRAELYIDDFYHDAVVFSKTDGYIDVNKDILPLSGRHTLAWRFFGEFQRASMDTFCFTKKG